MQDFEALQGRPFPSTPSDSPWTWAAGYVLLVPFVIAGLVVLVRAGRRPGRATTPGIDVAAMGVLLVALTIWTTLIFLPVTPFQRRFSEGAIIPLAALAGLGLTSLVRREAFFLIPIVCCSIIGVGRIASEGEYVPNAYWSVFRQINQQDVVLAGDALASVLPAYSPGAAFVARTTETIHYADKDRIRRSFLDDPNSEGILARLSAGGVTLVLADSVDKDFDVPAGRLRTECYRPAFRFGSVTGYRLNAGCGPD
jgi:hypothetical protein